MASPFVKGGVAVVTGAAAGIGKALAVRCGKAGMRVVLVDVSPLDIAMAEVLALDRSAPASTARARVCAVGTG